MSEFATEISIGVEHVVRFVKNISFFMEIGTETGQKTSQGESDQLELLKKGDVATTVIFI